MTVKNVDEGKGEGPRGERRLSKTSLAMNQSRREEKREKIPFQLLTFPPLPILILSSIFRSDRLKLLRLFTHFWLYYLTGPKRG